MNDLKLLVFSKDRPLQLEAYLSSLFALTDIKPENVYIIMPEPYTYKNILSKYLSSQLLFEDSRGGFFECLKQFYQSISEKDTILFGCDDCVFIRPVVTKIIAPIVWNNSKVLGFSLRLGNNISGASQTWSENGMCGNLINKWYWPGKANHWGYPFELMGTVYRSILLKEIIDASIKQNYLLKSPNYLESFGTQYCIEHKKHDQPIMVSFNTNNYLVACDVNRVQDDFPNKFTGTEEQSPEYLKKAHEEGKKMDWQNLFNITPPDIFVGNLYFKLISN